MTSRLLTLLRILQPSRGGANLGPNSHAVIQLWRRVFELREKEAEEGADILEEVLGYSETGGQNRAFSAKAGEERSSSSLRPIASDEATHHRSESIKRFYRSEQNRVDSVRVSEGGALRDVAPEPGFRGSECITPQRILETQQISRPNRDIPVQSPADDGLAYVSLAQ